MEKKLKSDEIAYQVTLRKYEEGLMSPIDLQTSANALIQSRASLLQKKLMYLLKSKQVDYYKGEPLIETPSTPQPPEGGAKENVIMNENNNNN